MSKILNISNAITLFRLLLSIPIFYFLLNNDITYAVIIFVIFLLLDIVDGQLARKLKQETEFGKNFDYLTDVIFGGLIFFTQLLTNKIPTLIWTLALVNYILYGILVLFTLVKAKSFLVTRIKNFEAPVYYLFLLLLLINIYNTWLLIIFYILLVFMYYLIVDYFIQIKKELL